MFASTLIDAGQQLLDVRDEVLTPEDFEQCAWKMIWQLKRRQRDQAGQFQPSQIAEVDLDPEAFRAHWFMLEHVANLGYLNLDGCRVWQEGVFRESRWRLTGTGKPEPVLLRESVYTLVRERLSAVMVYEREGKLFPGYRDLHAETFP